MLSFNDAKIRMDEALEAMRREFSTVRTGKATPALLDTVRVDAYGAKMPLNQVASIATPESSMLLVQPFDKSIIADIERAIMSADFSAQVERLLLCLTSIDDHEVDRWPKLFIEFCQSYGGDNPGVEVGPDHAFVCAVYVDE